MVPIAHRGSNQPERDIVSPETTVQTQMHGEPTEAPGWKWVLAVVFVNAGVMAGFFGPIQVLIAQQAEAIRPANAQNTVYIVTAIGALVSTIVNPLWGELSDRTRSRFGRRVPWVLGGAFATLGAFWVLASASSVSGLVFGWMLGQASLNASFAAISAAIPDQVPVRQRATVGGVIAVAHTLGPTIALGLVAATSSITVGYLSLSALVIVLCIPYLFLSRDTPATGNVTGSTPASIEPETKTGRGRSGDYWWAWITRFLMHFANALLMITMYLYLRTRLGLSQNEAEGATFMLTALYSVLTLVTAVAGGIWSDRLGVRKPFVIWSGLVAAGGLASLGLVTSLPLAYGAAAILGLGYGMYLSVDFALLTEVLPDAEARGRDLGILNIAAALPQVFAPGFAYALQSIDGVSYATVYLAAGLISVLGSVLVVNIKGVR